ncbi:hypothetical protein LSAT2_014484 [Lamellibrachia satsuma]|nr:hypothetical protein LSAT2_014484 [Lamellibrachia satsuma]
MTILRSLIKNRYFWLPVLTYGAAIAGHTVFTQWRPVTFNSTVLDKWFSHRHYATQNHEICLVCVSGLLHFGQPDRRCDGL